MNQELIDIVDENNNPTGEIVERKEAHDKGLWHRTVHVYFYRLENNAYELLVHLRSKDKDSSPNMWDTRFGGHLEAGQDILEAGIKEVAEETGQKITSEDLEDGNWQGTSESSKHFSYNLFYHFKGDERDIRFDDGEVQEVKWMSLDAISQELIDSPKCWTQKAESFKKVQAFLKRK